MPSRGGAVALMRGGSVSALQSRVEEGPLMCTECDVLMYMGLRYSQDWYHHSYFYIQISPHKGLASSGSCLHDR